MNEKTFDDNQFTGDSNSLTSKIKPSLQPAKTPIFDFDKQNPCQNNHWLNPAIAEYQSLSDSEKLTFQQAYQDFKHPFIADYRLAKHYPERHKRIQQNPTNLTNPYWQWVVRHELPACDIRQLIHDDTLTNRDTPFDKRVPLWCFERMGQTHTTLPDGRIIFIGGEFDDSYDPDFCIYNDVVVKYPDGNIEIYGYPKSIFPPTDFHSATLVGDEIIIIGSLGYPEDRRFQTTPVYALNIHSYTIRVVETHNNIYPIAWINKHTATLKDKQIIISGGRRLGEDTPLLENIDTWALNLSTLKWKNLSQRQPQRASQTPVNRQWQQFYVIRKDQQFLHIDEIKNLLDLEEQLAKIDNDTSTEYQQINTEYQSTVQQLTEALGGKPDLHSYQSLCIPPIHHDIISHDYEDLHADAVVEIDGVRIRYQCEYDNIQVVIEGQLAEDIVELLQENLRHKLTKIEKMACEVVEVV
ncbi:hypothetical protein [Psychrobacter sp. I-STPA6b]|uniref:hypothetical protein n=1 Tax=Psychrobacter sp. I-STPA6b TaxID=2585718 RepID=UPI001D0CD54E|nr:hypothetical protein [Psychrobacter sp. I-STPA6b]